MSYRIELPAPEDAASVGRLVLRAWLETCPHADAGIDDTWIRRQKGAVVTPEGIAQWRAFIEEAADRPDRAFCRVVRNASETVGVLCGRRDEAITLGPMYLLSEAQGQSVGGRLMAEFLAWAGDAPVLLWVTEYNSRAVRFYERHGFTLTHDRTLWRGRLPNVRMVRGRSGRVTG